MVQELLKMAASWSVPPLLPLSLHQPSPLGWSVHSREKNMGGKETGSVCGAIGRKKGRCVVESGGTDFTGLQEAHDLRSTTPITVRNFPYLTFKIKLALNSFLGGLKQRRGCKILLPHSSGEDPCPCFLPVCSVCMTASEYLDHFPKCPCIGTF